MTLTTPSQWFLYIIQTEEQTLYTGITTNVERRLALHQTGKGAKYVKGRGTLTVMYQIEVESRSQALKLEYRIKQLTRTKKWQIITQQPTLSELIELLNFK